MRSEEISSTSTLRIGLPMVAQPLEEFPTAELPPPSDQATPTAARKWAGWRVARGDNSSSTMLFTALLLPTSQLLFLVKSREGQEIKTIDVTPRGEAPD